MLPHSTLFRLSVFCFLIPLLLGACTSESKGSIDLKEKPAEEVRLGIQPFQGISKKDIEAVKTAVEDYYGFTVEILPTIKMPPAFYTTVKSPRYRADSILHYLREERLPSTQVILGLTHYDISTTKHDALGEVKKPQYKYLDWGIFGLGSVGGGACVVSNFRLGRKVGPQQKTIRLQKVALHEVGHALGLPHCPNDGCFMRDAVERIGTLDEVNMALCGACKGRIGQD